MKSPESIPLPEYRWLHVVLSFPVALLFEIYFWVVGRLSRVEAPSGFLPLPSNAIVVLLHPEWPLFPPSLSMWNKIAPKFCWVGLHHFSSYCGSLSCVLSAYPCFRFSRGDRQKPFERIVAFLNEHPNLPFAVRTDSGGPYGQVRHSAVAMALRTGRPVVCLRQVGTRVIVLPNTHAIPLPFGTIRTRVSRAFSAEELSKLPIDAARETLQAEIQSPLLSATTGD